MLPDGLADTISNGHGHPAGRLDRIHEKQKAVFGCQLTLQE